MESDEFQQAATLAALRVGPGDDALRSVTGVSIVVIASCDAASLSITGTGGVTTRAATDPLAETLDEIQYRTGEGPCLDAISTGTVSRPCPPETESRWPNFRRESQAHGLMGTLSTPLRVDQQVVGSLNLYARSEPFRLTEHDEIVSAVLASYAGLLISSELEAERHDALVDQLNQALASRDIIGQAKGVLIAREGCDADQAFDMLRRASQRLNKKLRDVAEQIVRSATAGPSSHRRG